MSLRGPARRRGIGREGRRHLRSEAIRQRQSALGGDVAQPPPGGGATALTLRIEGFAEQAGLCVFQQHPAPALVARALEEASELAQRGEISRRLIPSPTQ